MERSNPARLYCGVVGATLVAAGIIGFFYITSFETGDTVEREAVLGILDVNGWHNVVHLLSGVALLLAYKAGNAVSRQVALIFGVVYLLVTILGFIVGDGEVLINLLPINTEDNILHLLLTISAFAAYGASKETTDHRTTTAAA